MNAVTKMMSALRISVAPSVGLVAGIYFLVLGMLAMPAVSVAQEDSFPAPVIGVININKVERQSLAWESLRRQVEERRARLQQEIQGLQSTLEKRARDIESRRDLLSEEAFAEEVRGFQQEKATLQEQTDVRTQELEHIYSAARAQIREALGAVLMEIAEKNGINIVMAADTRGSNIMFAQPDLVLDDEALRGLNQAITEVVLPDTPQGSADANAPQQEQP